MQVQSVIFACFHWSASLPVNTAVVFTPGLIMLLGWSQNTDISRYGAETTEVLALV